MNLSDLNVGFECEVASGGPQLAGALHAIGLAKDDRLHAYHCSCCRCNEQDYGFMPQEDCTVSGEMVSYKLRYDSDGYHRTVDGLGRAAILSGASAGPRAGCHVHVGSEGMDTAAQLRLMRLFLTHQRELALFANGRDVSVRDYNTPVRAPSLREEPQYLYNRGTGYYDLPNPLYRTRQTMWSLTGDESGLDGLLHSFCKGQWLAYTGRTYEFRLWNSTVAPWRIRMYVGLSVAFVAAAIDGADATERTNRTMLNTLGDYLDGQTLASVVRQLKHNPSPTATPTIYGMD